MQGAERKCNMSVVLAQLLSMSSSQSEENILKTWFHFAVKRMKTEEIWQMCYD